MIRQSVNTEQILSYIAHRDSSNPILSRDLEKYLDISGPAVRDAIRLLRRSGHPIVATEHGYFYAQTPEEVDIIVQDLSARISSLSKTRSAILQKAYERFQLQRRFEFGSTNCAVQGAEQGRTDEASGDSEEKTRRRDLLSMQLDNNKSAQGYLPGECADNTSDASLVDELVGV